METGVMNRLAVTTAFFAALAAGAFLLGRPRAAVPFPVDLASFPDSVGKWNKAEEITFDKKALELLGPSDVLGRIYAEPSGRKVQLIVVRAVNNRAAFHPPEYCMTGAGSELIGKGTGSLDMEGQPRPLDFNEMVFAFKGSTGKFLLCNWYYSAGRGSADFYRQQTRLVLDEIGGSGRGAVVNVYVPVENEDMHGARALVADFMRSLAPLVPEYL